MANNYIYMSPDELYHWKYIKREKVNGKWKYYYDADQLKKDVKNLVSDPIGVKAKKTYQQAQQKTINAQNNISSRRMSDVQYREASNGNGPSTTSTNNRAARAKAAADYGRDSVDLAIAKVKETAAKEKYDKTIAGKVDKRTQKLKNRISESIAERKQDWEESKERGTEKAKKEASKYDGGIVIKDGHAKKIGKTSFKDTDKLLSGTTTIETTTTQVNEVRRGKIDRFADTAKEYIKDRFGFDEREKLEKANKNVEQTEHLVERAYKIQDEAFVKYITEDDPVKKAEAKKEYDKRMDETIKIRSKSYDAIDERNNASFEYNKTALKKTEDVKRFVDDRIFDLTMAVDNILKFPGAAAAVVGDKFEDIAFDIEYETSRAIGIAQKKRYESAKNVLELQEEKYRRSKGTNKEFIEEVYLNRAKENYEKARNAYSGTPLERLESGRDYIEDLLTGNKKRKKR